MANSSRRANNAGREARKSTEAGLTLVGFGIMFLVLPSVLGASPLGNVFLSLRSMAGWMVLAGVIVLGVGLLVGRRSASDAPQGAAPVPSAPSARALAAGRQSGDPPEGPRTSVTTPPADVAGRRIAAAPLALNERPASWGKPVFDVIEWRRFEAVVERLFQQAGFETSSQSHGADEGVDVWLFSRHQPGEPVSLVQCKHWQGKKVGVDKVRELRGVMAARQVKRGQFATTSAFTPDAVAFARANGINLLDVDGLLELIGTRSPEQQAELLDVALEGDYWRPTCVNCGLKMVERQPKRGGSAFWGCMGFPKCRTTLPMRTT